MFVIGLGLHDHLPGPSIDVDERRLDAFRIGVLDKRAHTWEDSRPAAVRIEVSDLAHHQSAVVHELGHIHSELEQPPVEDEEVFAPAIA